MKTIKHLAIFLSLAGIVLLLFIGGCQKEHPSNFESIIIDKGLSLKEGTGKFTIKSDTIPRLSKLSSNSIEKIKSVLNQKKKNQTATVSNTATFTATITAGTTDYYCTAEMPFAGPVDWYLIEESTSTYTYIGTTASESIFFFISSPTPGYYRVWGQSASNGLDTNPLYLGNPYPGVALNNGVLEFTDLAAYQNLIAKLEYEVEQHNADFVDPREYMTDDEINNLAMSIGFDEFKPLRDFENYFGFQSYRQLIESQENQWLQNDILDMDTDPDGNSSIVEDVPRALINHSGYVKISGNTINFIDPSPFAQPFEYCFLFGRNANYYPPWDNDSKTFKYLVALRNFPWQVGGVVVAKTINLKKKSAGGWERYFTKTESRISGTVYNQDCLYKGSFTTGSQSPKRHKSKIAKEKYWGQIISSKPSNISSYHYSNGRQINHQLQF